MNTRSKDSILPNVKVLDFEPSNCNGLDATSLTIWLRLAPHVTKLNFQGMDNMKRMELVVQLNKLLEMDPRLESVFNRIKRVDVCRRGDLKSPKTKSELFSKFYDVFVKAKLFPK